MKKLFYLCCVIILTACSHRIVENPFISTATSMQIDVSRIERTDTATIVDFEFFGHPKYALQMSSSAYLVAEGQRYTLLSIDQGEIGEWIKYDEKGQLKIKAYFEPIPKRAKTIDYINAEKEQYIWGIDLTGKQTFAHYPDGLPEELQSAENDCDIPEPIFKVGKSNITIHLLGYRAEMGDEVKLIIHDLMESSADSRSYIASINPETHTATTEIFLEGTTFTTLRLNDAQSLQWLAPGENTDIYLDLRSVGSRIMSRRGKPFDYLKLYEWRSQIPAAYTTGTYSQLNRAFNSMKHQPIRLNPQTNGYYGDYRLTRDKYTTYTKQMYRKLLDSIDRHPTMSSFEKRISKIYTDLDLVYVAAGYPWITHMSEVRITGAARHPKAYKDCSDEQLYEMVEPFDWNDTSYCLFTKEVADFLGITDNLPNRLQLPEDNFYTNIREATHIKFRIDRDNGLSAEDAAQLKQMHPFFQEVCKTKDDEIKRRLSAKYSTTKEETPKTDAEKLFDAIIAPYKGKVVVVDFWNTWCGPCMMAHKEIEPLKTNELKSDEIVWIYIADDSSPEATYNEKIQTIKGIHYHLSNEEAKSIKQQFSITAIPSYVLVEKSGEYKLRNDLRNTNTLKSELKKRIGK